ncbi:uncharacterized protein [Diadema antillarum]|uniref:uncharacterized protein n=1 Tax=Diadema antillarum TaxID=105358 RepID=UPI003A83B2D9
MESHCTRFPVWRGSLGIVSWFILVLSSTSVDADVPCRSARKGVIPGEVTVGLLVPFTAPSADGLSCDENGAISDVDRIQLIEAAIYATNSGGGQNIGLEVLDTCNSAKVSVEQSIAYLSERATPTASGLSLCDSAAYRPVVIGQLENDAGPAVSSLLTDARVPVISYAATLTELTANPEYRFFSRNIPSDDDIARAMVDVLKRMGWTYVAVIASDTTDGNGAGETFRDVAEANGICVSVFNVIAEGTTESGDFDTALADIAANSNLRVVVLFVSSDLARGLFDAASRLPSVNLQWMAGHRTLLDPSSLDQQPLITRGLLGVLPSSFLDTQTNFDTYFQNLTPDTVNTTADPWFLDYWQEKLGCNIGSASGSTPQCGPTHVQQHRDTYVRNPYVSSVLAAMYIAGHSSNTFQLSRCGSIDNFCDAFATASPTEWLDAIRAYRLQAQSSTEGFRTDGSTLDTELTIVNMRTSATSGYSLQEVSTWKDGTSTFDPNGVEVWTGLNAQPVQSTCGAECRDQACVSATSNDTMVYQPGDLILGGLFSVHNWDSVNEACGEIRKEGVLRLEAMLYQLDQINQDNDLLPSITLGVDAFDTCSNALQAGLASQRFITSAEFGKSGFGERITDDGQQELVYGVIGPSSDQELITTNRVLSLYEVPIISYESSSSTLSSSTNYPNVARVTAVNYADTIPLARALAEGGFKYVQVVYTSSYSSASSVFNSIGNQHNLCVSQALRVSETSTQADWDDVITKLDSRPEAKVVVILTEASVAQIFITQLQTRGLTGRYYLVGNNAFPFDEVSASYPEILNGITIVERQDRQYPSSLRSYLLGLRPETNVRNPWFAEFWMNRFQCRLDGYQSAYTNLCTGSETLDDSDIDDKGIGDVIDATYIMAVALNALQEESCNAAGVVCIEMTTSPGSDLFRLITSQNLRSPLGDDRQIRFNSIGDAVESFYINNYVMGAGRLQSVLIASYISYSFVKTSAEITVVDENGARISGPVVECTGLCDECTKIDKGSTATSATQADIWIGGFFDITEPEADQFTCSDTVNDYNIQLVEAFLFAIDQVNEDDSILTNFKLGGIGFDTCGSAEKARREISNFVGGSVEYRSGYFTTSISVAGIVGDQTSDVSIAIADTLNSFMVNQVSYGASSTELSDHEKYPYFLRTVPSDTQQASAMVALIQRFDWSYVSVVYSDNAYGNDIYEIFRKQAQEQGICIAMAISVMATGVVDYTRIVNQLTVNPQSKVVILLTSDFHTKGVLDAAEELGVNDLQWIGGDTWGSREYVTEDAMTTARGALIVELPNPEIQAFYDYFIKLTPYGNNRNPWWRQFIMDIFECQVSGLPTRFPNFCYPLAPDWTGRFTLESEVSYIMNAVRAMAIGLDEAIKSLCPDIDIYESCDEIYSNPTVVHNHILQAAFTGADGSLFSFDDNGDGQPLYDIINLIDEGGNLTYYKVGVWNSDNLQIPPNTVRFYDGMSEVNSLISQCSGRCAECSTASAVQTTTIQRQGELQIPALFAAHSSSNDINRECGDLRYQGVFEAEALLFAVNAINEDEGLLPGVTVGTVTFDTCQSAGRWSGLLSGFLSGATTGDHQPWFQIAGVIGGGNVAIDSADIAGQYQYMQATYSSITTTDDDPSSLLSVAESNNHKARALTDLLLYYNWNLVGVVYDSSDFQQRELASAFEDAADNQGIYVGLEVALTTDNILAAHLAFQNSESINVVVVFADKPLSKSFLDSATTDGSEGSRRLTFILAFPRRFSATEITSNFAGSLAFFQLSPPSNFQQYVTTLSAEDENASPWFVDYIEDKYDCDADGDAERQSPCLGSERASVTDIENYGSAASLVIDAVYTIARGTDNLLRQLCGDNYSGFCTEFLEAEPQALRNAIAGVSFIGSDGKPVRYVDQVREPLFEIWNGQESEGSVDFAGVGTWEIGDIQLRVNEIELYTPASLPGPARSQCSDSSFCRPASPSTTEPSGTRSYAARRSYYSGVGFYVLIIIAAVGALIAVFVGLVVIVRWNNPAVRGVSSFLHLTLLLGILLLFILVPLYYAPALTAVCGLQRVVTGIAYATCYSSVFLLVTRLYRIGVRERRITGKRAPMINNASQAMLFAVLFLIEVVFLVQWLVQQPPWHVVEEMVTATEDSSPTGQVYCGYVQLDMAISLLYVYLLMVLSLGAAVQAWCSVKVVFSREFSVYMITLSVCIMVMVGWIIALVLVERGSVRLVSSIGAIAQATILLFALIIPKLKILFMGNHDEFWESASVTSSEYGGDPRASSKPTLKEA